MSRETITKAMMLRAIAAFASAGTPVKSARIHSDGSIDLLTEPLAGALPANDDGDWVDLAGETDLPRAKGA